MSRSRNSRKRAARRKGSSGPSSSRRRKHNSQKKFSGCSFGHPAAANAVLRRVDVRAEVREHHKGARPLSVK